MNPLGGSEASGPAKAEQSETSGAAAVARDWITLWQSELAAISLDREVLESWYSLISLLNTTTHLMSAMISTGSRTEHCTDGSSRALTRPGPLMRRGPRPLLLHLMLAMLRSRDSSAEWQNLSNVWQLWSSAPSGAMGTSLDQGEKTLLLERVGRLILEQMLKHETTMISGIAAYRRHPHYRVDPDPSPMWQEGESLLLDYAPTARGLPILFVPSLINRGYILDLAPQNSLLGYLRDEGARPILLEWGWPGQEERHFTLTDYVAGRLERAIAAIGRPVVLAGYCMGGLLALASAQRLPNTVAGVACLATPWDFRSGNEERADALMGLLPMLEPMLNISGTLPIDVIQSLFALLDPCSVPAKFKRFSRLEQGDRQAQLFVEVEDWLNDGVPLAAPVARECLSDWYGHNSPFQGRWRVAGMEVTPAAVQRPTFVAIPLRDRIVPPQSARPLAKVLPNATVVEPPAGHVGMVVGGAAKATLWQPLLSWLRAI